MPRTRDHLRMIERLIALAEAYGCSDLEAMRADIDVVIRIEYLTFDRRVRTAQELTRRRVAKISHSKDAASVQPEGARD